MLITIVGNDGSGKSTIIHGLASELGNKKQVKVIEEFSGPLFSIIKKFYTGKTTQTPQDKKGLSTHPSKGNIYFYILWVDTILEYIYIKVVLSKYIVIKDRYFQDHLATIIELKKTSWVLQKLYTFYPHPDLCFRISVSPKIALERRKGDIKYNYLVSDNFHKKKKKIYDSITNTQKNVILINNEGKPKNAIQEIITIIKRRRTLVGRKSIKISGIDGAGKSTTINNIKDELERLNIGYVDIHFYYNYIPTKILKIYKKISGIPERSTEQQNKASIEHEKKSINKDRSMLWKLYVIVDALIQTCYINIVGWNKVKIYDRFFLDYKASWDYLGISYPENFFKIFKNYNTNYFLLLADPETLYKRKPEHTEKFFKKTVTLYKHLAKDFGLEIIDTKKHNPDEVKNNILKKIK